ncbi:MAG: YbaK/EbsC family protein [Desulfobacteraceae bacterium]|nr:MAG: YbaK/EbsC family protein [Desulfobacteraceae bacterium]
MPLRKVEEFLESNKIKYEKISHSQAFTAQEIAASAHIPGKELAKTVMVKVDGKMAMAVLPASHRVDFNLLKAAAEATKVELAKEGEFRDTFPDCEVGAMSPFGNLYELDVFVEENLAENEKIAFNAGSHTELIRVPYKDFKAHVKPKVAIFSSGLEK